MSNFDGRLTGAIGSEYTKQADEYLSQIRMPELQNAIVDLINKYAEPQMLRDAVEVIKTVIFLMKEDKIINDGPTSVVVDLQIATGFLHNLFYKYNDDSFGNVFKLREVIADYDLAPNMIDPICQSIECQLGKNSPNKLLIPGATTPSAQFALACSFYYKILK